jgi:multidrug resistance protein, MATE family
MTNRIPILHVRQEAGATVRLAAPLIAAQLAHMSITFVDTVMAGNLSPRDLAAVAVGSGLWFPIWALCAGVLLAVTPSVAQLYGANRHDDIGHCVREGLWLSAGSAVVAFLLARNAFPLLLTWLKVDPEVAPLAARYLQALSWGAPAMCAYQVFRSFNEGVSQTRPVMYASILALGGNIAGNYIFMYGKLGMPALGAVGCGVASAIVLWLTLGFLAGYTYLNPQNQTYGLFRRFDAPRWTDMAHLARIGIPISISLFMEASFFGAVALVMSSLGTKTVAGHQIALNVAAITFMVPLGLAMAISVRVGQALGRQDMQAARFSGFVGIGLAGAFMTCSALAMFAFPEFIASIYTAVTLLFMAAIFQISDGLQVSGAGALRGLKDTKVPMLITSIAYWGIGMPLGYLLGITWGGGPSAIWVGFIFGLAVAAVLLNGRFHWITRGTDRAMPTF